MCKSIFTHAIGLVSVLQSLAIIFLDYTALNTREPFILGKTKAYMNIKLFLIIFLSIFSISLANARLINSETLLKNAKSVVQITSVSPTKKSDSMRATGFFISHNLVVTNYHVIENSFVSAGYNNYIKIKTYDSDTYNITKVEFVDALNDMAILKVKGAKSKSFIDIKKQRKESHFVKSGDSSFVIGFPAFSTLEVNRGYFVFTNNTLNQNEITVSGRNLQPGVSGSPVFNDEGLLVGLFNSITPINSGFLSCPKKGYVGYLTNSDLLYKNFKFYKEREAIPDITPIMIDFHIQRTKASTPL